MQIMLVSLNSSNFMHANLKQTNELQFSLIALSCHLVLSNIFITVENGY